MTNTFHTRLLEAAAHRNDHGTRPQARTLPSASEEKSPLPDNLYLLLDEHEHAGRVYLVQARAISFATDYLAFHLGVCKTCSRQTISDQFKLLEAWTHDAGDLRTLAKYLPLLMVPGNWRFHYQREAKSLRSWVSPMTIGEYPADSVIAPPTPSAEAIEEQG